MKFKQVEISAFRIYNKPEDSKFDFTMEDGEIADFISLYAPNGFGKTSFYDAVEWGITNTISRFAIREENEKLYDSQKGFSKSYFLRNTKSDEKLKTKVKITTNEKEIEHVWKQRKNARSETSFKTIPHDFQKVILSQEWISAFLTEVKGDERYNRFMELPELVEINTYYKNIIALIAECHKKKKENDVDIEKLRTQLKSSEDPNFLETINNQIELINKRCGNDISLVDLDYTDSQVLELKDNISSLYISQNNEVKINQQLVDIAVAINGNDRIPGLTQFYADRERFQILKAENETVQDNLKRFQELDGKIQEQKIQKQNSTKLNEQLKNALNTKSNFSTYSEIADKLGIKKNEVKSKNLSIKELTESLEKAKRAVLDSKNRHASLIKQITELLNQQRKIPEHKENLLKYQTKKIDLEKAIGDYKGTITKHKEGLNKIREEILSIKKVQKEIREGKYPMLPPMQKPELLSVLENLRINQDKLEKNKEGIESLQLKTKEHKSLNTTIEEFIKTGLELASHNHTSRCPLCEHQYDSFEHLAEKISSNVALNNQLQVLLKENSALETEQKDIRQEIEKNVMTLLKEYDEIINELFKSEKDVNDIIQPIENQLKLRNSELNLVNDNIKEINITLNGLKIEAFEDRIIGQLKELQANSNKYLKMVEDDENGVKDIEQKLSQFRGSIELLNSEIQAFEEDKIYKEVLGWILDNFSKKHVITEDLTAFISKMKNEINELENEIANTNKSILNLQKHLRSISKESTQSKLNKLQTEIERIQKRTDTYLYYLKNTVGISFQDKTKDQLLSELNNKSEKYKIELKELEKLKKELEKLTKFIENLKEFLQSERIKSEIEKHKREWNFLDKKVEPKLQNEKEKTIAFIEEKIHDFFHTKLINQIYNKLDPHPEFKNVQFKTNFEFDRPRLDVYVSDKTDESKLIPNLYFSTAQINILSLSIFLATALNTVKYDCIFIDDPIQSMDSINILSTIDLLRSISLNYGKQIILSTHDENFHNLLKKKIPSELFKSKFIELETFGKVKIVEQAQ